MSLEVVVEVPCQLAAFLGGLRDAILVAMAVESQREGTSIRLNCPSASRPGPAASCSPCQGAGDRRRD